MPEVKPAQAGGEAAANPLAAFGRWIADTPADWPAEAVAAARLQYIDLLGVAIAGAGEEAARLTRETVAGWGEGPATVIGQGAGMAPPWAALANGAAAHALDFDDNFDPAKAHASAVLVPAILALAEEQGTNGRAALDAYIVGLQIMGRTGQALNPYHRDRGWHATATAGAIGAAAAGARLLRLSARQSAHALSLATSMASGSMAQFGTMAKPLHAGLAAKAGVMAACLARSGVTAGEHTLDGPHGIARLMVGPDFEQLRDSLDRIEHGQTMRFETQAVGDPLLILSDGFRVKRFANCGSAHRAMDALLELIETHDLRAEEVERITVSAPASHLANLRYTRPDDPLQAKFSLEFGLAMLLLQRECRLADFAPAMVADERVRALYPRIARVPVDSSEGAFPTRVHVRLRDGREYAATAAVPVGSRTRPFSEDIYWAKFASCLAYAGRDPAAGGLQAALADLEGLTDIRVLGRAMRAG